MLNCVDGDHRNVHTLLDALGQVLFPALLKRIGLNDGPAGFITAGGDIQAGNANALQVPRDVLAFLFVHTVIPEIGSVHTNGDREVSAAGKANTHDNFCGETHAVEEVAAVFIRAVIGVRGHELINKIAMSSVNFHTIEPCGLCNDSALDKTLHHGLNFCGRHFFRHNPHGFAHYGRGTNDRIAVQRDWEGLVARVVQLHEHLGAICMNTIYHTGKAGDHIHICCTQLTRLRNAGQFIYTADFRDDQADASFCALFIITRDFFGCFTGCSGKAGAHGGHDNAVFNCEFSDFALFKKLFVLHTYITS